MTDTDSKPTTYERIRDRIRIDIVAGDLEPGRRLTVAALAKRYGSGPMPIRTALHELQGLGLVITTPRQGARVRPVDAEFVANVCDLRAAVIAMLLPRVTHFIGNAEIDEIAAIQARIEEAAARDDLAATMQHNRDFHRSVFTCARNPIALDAMERTWALLDGLRARYGFGEGRWRTANASHRALIAALRKRDIAACTAAMLDSLDRSKRDLIDCVSQRGVPNRTSRAGRASRMGTR